MQWGHTFGRQRLHVDDVESSFQVDGLVQPSAGENHAAEVGFLHVNVTLQTQRRVIAGTGE